MSPMSTLQPGATGSQTEQEPAPGRRPLTWQRMFLFGLADMPIQMAGIPLAAYIPNYYGMDLGVSLAAVGTIWLVARLFDAITDPLIGYLSDRTRTRWGRRRVWMLASLPLSMIAIYQLFIPEPPVTAAYLLGWLLVFWLGWTMLFIPYYAWAAELSPDYHERSLITGWRAGVGMAANVFSKVLPVLMLLLFGYGGTREVLLMIGAMTLVLLPLTVGLTCWSVPEGRVYAPSYLPIGRGLRIMWSNGPFRNLLWAFMLSQLGGAMSTALVIFFIRSVLHEEEGGILMLLAFYTANLFSIAFWVRISRRIGKHRALMAGLLVLPCFQPLYLLLGPGDFVWMLPIAAITGFAGGASWVLPNSMKADVIDLDRLKCGEDRAAWFFSVWSLAIKLAVSFGPWLALSLVTMTGYAPAATAPNTDAQLWGLKAVFVFGPSIGYLLSAVVLSRYTLTEAEHQHIRQQLTEQGR